MKEPVLIARRELCIAGLGAVLLPSPLRATETDPAQIMQLSYQATRFENARFSATLSLQSGSGAKLQRNLMGLAKIIDQGAQARLIRFASPADIAGVATLTVERGARGDDLWIYLPATKRVRRLVTANRADPWVGSDFSFGDILGHKVTDWRHELAGSPNFSGADCWKITSTPGNPALVRETGYAKRESWIRKSDFSLVRCDFFGGNGEAIKSAVFSDFKAIDARRGKVQPMTMAMHSLRKSSTSVLRFSQFITGQGVHSDELKPEALLG